MTHLSVLLPACALLLAACASSVGPPATADQGDVSGAVTVFAAASLSDAFAEIARAFEVAYPEATVTLNLAGSQQLATQILEGAPADVFASADAEQMARVVDAGLTVGTPEVFARNRLAIAVEPGNPAGISTLQDLARDDLTVVLAADEVPVGRYTRRALAAAGATVAPASEETDVRAVLTRVALGEADAGVVYDSDIVTAGDRVSGVAIPDGSNVVATYPIAALRAAPHPRGADAFVTLVLSDGGRAALQRAGLRPAAGDRPSNDASAAPAAVPTS